MTDNPPVGTGYHGLDHEDPTLNADSNEFGDSQKRWSITRSRFYGVIAFLGATFFLLGVLTGFLSWGATRKDRGVKGPKSVIFMISDGWGRAGQTMTRTFVDRDLLHLDSVYVGASRTYSTNSLVTDSAAGATAFSCAQKTANHHIGTTPGNKETSMPCGTLLEAAALKGMKTGLVATSRITHATPGSFAAHVLHRDLEDEIARQMADQQRVDVLLGGGRRHFEASRRNDSRDLVGHMRDEQKYDVALTADELAKADPSTGNPLLGLFASSHMSFELDRLNQDEEVREPSLLAMATKALQWLTNDAAAADSKRATSSEEKGFFLMIEGSRIDQASHVHDAPAHVLDAAIYDDVVGLVLDYVEKNPNTLFVSTSDHETGGLSLAWRHVYPDWTGHANNGSHPGLRYCPPKQGVDLDYYWNVANLSQVTASAEFMRAEVGRCVARGEDPPVRADIKACVTATLTKYMSFSDLGDCDFEYVTDFYPHEWAYGDVSAWRAHVGWTTVGHSGEDVTVYAAGPKDAVEKLRGVQLNSHIGEVIRDFLDLDLDEATKPWLEGWPLPGAVPPPDWHLMAKDGQRDHEDPFLSSVHSRMNGMD